MEIMTTQYNCIANVIFHESKRLFRDEKCEFNELACINFHISLVMKSRLQQIFLSLVFLQIIIICKEFKEEKINYNDLAK